jgi:hypothetical protein
MSRPPHKRTTPPPKKVSGRKIAPIGEVQKAASTWRTPVLQCRLMGHSWKQTRGEHILRYHYWYVEFACDRKCGVRKWEEWSETGDVLAKGMVYPTDSHGHHTYLLSGFGHIDGSARGVLRLESVIRFNPIEVNGDAEHDEDNQPRSSRTEKFLKESKQWPSK